MDNLISTIKNNLDKPVVIVGMMGTGKSHLGRKLAAALGLDFHDSDRLIESKAGRSVGDIFRDFGEEKFREAEKATILELVDRGPCVIATGGGAVINDAVLEAIKSKTLSVWLKTDIKTTVGRLKDGRTRPLLQGGDPEQILEDLMRRREPLYAQANITVESVDGSVSETLEKLIKALCSAINPDRFETG